MIYLDFAATTPTNPEVLKAFDEVTINYFGNTGSLHDVGVKAATLVEHSRNQVAELLKVKPEEIIFTSGATEANNLAIKGVALANKHRGNHVITTKIEHASVYDTCQFLETYFGFDVTYLNVDEYCRVDPAELAASMRDDTVLVSIMHVNSEVGSIQPIAELAEIVRQNPKTYFHVDMVQSFGKVPFVFEDLDIDMASFSMHKIFGLKGSGFLYKKNTVQIAPLISGGLQENGFRGGTQNTAAEIVVAKTVRLAVENFEAKFSHTMDMRNRLFAGIEAIPGVVINTPQIGFSPAMVNFSVVGAKPESIVHALAEREIYISTRSACSAKNGKPSRVLQAMPISHERAISGLRISVSYVTTAEEIDATIAALAEIVATIEKSA
ncbi:cysteine desulfurase family protein [Culicoidibacter larvae]|uniref:Cysteine desulfurase n=1 Tax=Culicoidibacter larvae TaxID=2579976 RepID=A0A5R8QB76_9FIRM|nr:cysteine desulfurase family protein [Culicoidibacter larvae]TLG72909.1 cysteine desulfurase [Culicoidibacter larvae]